MMRGACALWLAGMMALAGGCGKAPDRPAPPPVAPTSTAERSTLETVVDGVTGRDAVRRGEQAKDQIRRISAEAKKDREEILGEEVPPPPPSPSPKAP
jgi:hypothetical protein